MQQAGRIVTLKGKSYTLTGAQVKVGDQAPDFEAITLDLSPFRFSSVQGEICVLSAVPSLDTSVCDRETRRFNIEASQLGDDVEIITISMDLPFAQKRWCGATGVDRVILLSDHLKADFGLKYGVLIQELRLLARAVFVVDKEGVIRYVERVPEIAREPDYRAIITTVKELE